MYHMILLTQLPLLLGISMLCSSLTLYYAHAYIISPEISGLFWNHSSSIIRRFLGIKVANVDTKYWIVHVANA